MDGEIGVESDLGVGSNFWFELDLPIIDATKALQNTLSDGIKKRVLVIDDHPLGRKILQEYMTNWGFESAACVDAEEGMEMLNAMRKAGIAPDLVITDYIMPGLNGAQFIEKLSHSPDFNAIPVILLAQVSNTGNDDITKVSDRCVTVSKPFCIETIKPALDKRLPTTSSAQTKLAS